MWSLMWGITCGKFSMKSLLDPARMLSSCQPFPWSRKVHEADHCILNMIPCDNEFELAFSKFLDDAEDVAASNWCENATQLTKTTWRYIKVPQKAFEVLQPSRLEHLNALQPAVAARL